MNEKRNLTIEEAFASAIQNHRKNKFEVAENLYKEILKKNPNHFQTICLFGTLSIQTKNFERAKQLLHKAFQIQPNNAKVHNNLGTLFKELREFQKAINHFQKAIEIQPDLADAHYNLGIVYKELFEFQKAISCYQKVIQINPNYVDAHNNLGIELKELGDYQKAIICYEKVIQINPNNTAAHNNLGNVFNILGEYQKAINYYQKALKIKPDSIEAQANISSVYIAQLDNLEKAINASYKTQETIHKTLIFNNQRISLCRLKHDVQQAEYLSSKNYKINGIDKFQKIGNRILKSKENSEYDNSFNQKILLNRGEINSLLPFYKANHIYQTSKISEGCINPDKNWQDVEEQYFNSSKQIIYIDDFLSNEAIKELREFCLVSKIWNTEYIEKYLGAFSERGFISPIHLQIAIELKQKLPKLFGKHKLGKFWAFKYDSTLGKGIGIHADFALLNLNFWITPDEYNIDKDSGGLKVYDVPAPEDWTFQKYNNNSDEIYKFLNDNNANCTNIPYKFNRAVLFNSDYFHETDKINFKDGYKSRRINTTYLFGNRLIKKMN